MFDTYIHEDNYDCFLTEAQDLLQSIEQDLLSLKDERTKAKVHSLMRSAHTLKGAAASVGLTTIRNVAHVLEDLFKAFYNPNVVLDAEVETLLFQGYECLRMLVNAELVGSVVDESAVVNRVTSIIADLQVKVGDCFDQEDPIPTSTDLGFDIVQSMFELGINQRLNALEQAIAQLQPGPLTALLQTTAEIFLGLAESVQLPGFGAIAQTTLNALDANPHQVRKITFYALRNFRQGQAAVLAGDRTQGGMPSKKLQRLMIPPHTTLALIPAPTTPAPIVDSQETAAPPPQAIVQELDLELEHLFGMAEEPALPQPSSIPAGLIQPILLPAASFSDADLPSLERLLDEPESGSTNDTPLDSSLLPLDDHHSSANIHPEQGYPSERVINLTELEEADLLFVLKLEGNSGPEMSPVPAPVSPELVEPSPTLLPAAVKSSTLPSVRVDLKQLDRLSYLVGEVLTLQQQQVRQEGQWQADTQTLRQAIRQHRQVLSGLEEWCDRLTFKTTPHPPTASPHSRQLPLAGASTEPFDVLELDSYSDLYLFVQSVFNQVRNLEAIAERLEQSTQQASHLHQTQQQLLTELREGLTAARMRSMGDLLNRLPKVLDQLSTAYHKPVELILKGTDVLIDKAMLEKLYDPLLHLLRNAFDHGIEPLEVRRERGKREVGRIEIAAYRRGNCTVIDVADDGGGIDLERVAQRAIALECMTPLQVETASPQDLYDLLFQPGFSTTYHVTELSGRGIGLDVVASQIKALKGTISVTSTLQEGTRFTLALPMPLTLTRMLVCQVNGMALALPVDTIEQAVPLSSTQVPPPGCRGLLVNRQADPPIPPMPIYRLLDLLPYAAAAETLLSQRESPPRTTAVLLQIQTLDGLKGLIVDQVVEEADSVIRPLGEAIAPPSYIYGCCILSSNQLALAIEPERLLQLAPPLDSILLPPSVEPSPAASPPAQPSKAVRPSTILVVDDSPSFRHSLTRTLKEAGYGVIEATNGLEALEYLVLHPHIELVLCDIEMPQLNGFGFLNKLRQNPDLTHLPVGILSSRSNKKHRRLALELGASAYLTKPYIEPELLATVATLCHSSSASLSPV